MQADSDDILVRRAQENDDASFNVLVQRYYRMVFAVAYSRTRDVELSEELAQETFVRAFLNLSTLKDAQVLPAWLNRIARNLALDWQRRDLCKGVAAMIPIDDLSRELIDDRVPSARAAAASGEEGEIIRAALAQLGPDERELLLMHFDLRMTKSDIARALNVHPSSVGRQLQSALQALRRIMGRALNVQTGTLPEARRGIARTTVVVAALAAMPYAARVALASQASVAPPPLPPSAPPRLLSRAGDSISEHVHGAGPVTTAMVLLVGVIGGAYLLSSLNAGRISGVATRPTASARIASSAREHSPRPPERRATPRPQAVVTLASTATTEPRVVISGRALLPDGSPASGAKVNLVCSKPLPSSDRQRYSDVAAPCAETQAGPDGFYTLSGPNSGTLRMTVDDPRASASALIPPLSTWISGVYRPSGGAPTESGARQLHVDILLNAAETLHGKVVDESGTPISGATVSAWTGTTTSTKTDASGRFVVEGVSDLRRELQVATQELECEHGVSSTTGELSLQMPTRRFFSGDTTIRGTVLLYGADTPVPGAVVRLFECPGSVRLATTDGDGRYAFDRVSSGTYSLRASRLDLFSWPTLFDAEATTTAPGCIVERALYLRPGADLCGRVLDEATSAPIGDAEVFAGFSSEPLYHTVTGADGRYRLGPFKPWEKFWVQARKRGFCFASDYLREKPTNDSRNLGQRTGFCVTLENRSTDTAPLQLDLDMRAAPTISGIVRSPDGLPVVGARVMPNEYAIKQLISTGWGNRTFWRGDIMWCDLAATDEKGRFVLTANPNSATSILAEYPGMGIGVSSSFEITTGTVEGIDITLAKPSRVRGRVVDPQGKPVPLATVRAETRLVPAEGPGAVKGSNASFTCIARTDRDGVFIFENLGVPDPARCSSTEPGEVRFSVAERAYPSGAGEKLVTVTPGEETQVELIKPDK